jgi:hypothetical protein
MADSTNEFTIFYAWQSDMPPNGNRYLIEEAINEACGIISSRATYPYAVSLTSDTKGIPGLCDIPKEILKKIRTADAVVLDLTFIAKTGTKPPKYCPNPNVLFELGYAFRAVGSKRLICVMNEKFGPAAATLFDIAHRRHSVAYTFPAAGLSRKQVVERLAKSLADAIEPTIKLGPRSQGTDDAREFEREANEIESFWRSSQDPAKRRPTVLFNLRPVRFQKRRSVDGDALEELLRKNQIQSGMHSYPPSVKGLDRMPWGIYDSLYERPVWSMTYSGQFWGALPVNSYRDIKAGELDLHAAYPDAISVSAERWIDFPYALASIADFFRFAASMSRSFHPGEQVQWTSTAHNIDGTQLGSSVDSWMGLSRECGSPRAVQEGRLTAEEFTKDRIGPCASFATEFFGMYDNLGRRVSRETIVQHLASLAASNPNRY